MWYLWIAVSCFQLAVCGSSWQGIAVTPRLAVPDGAMAQAQVPPPRRASVQQEGAAEEAEEAEEGEEEIPAEIQLPTGPMRMELASISETRVRSEGEPMRGMPEASLRLNVNLTGERLGEIVSLGHLVIEHMIDDTGAVLASPEDLEARDLESTSPVNMSKRVLARGFVTRIGEAKAPSRLARKLTKVSGWVNVVYATETEDILVDNPLKFLGGNIEHPRLAELGIKVRVVKPGNEAGEVHPEKGLGLMFDGSRKSVRNVRFFDAWMKPMYPRPRMVKTAEGKEYAYYAMVVGQVDEDMQILFTVYPQIEEARIPFTFENVELP